MTKKIYVDVFVSLLLHISEGTYHRQFVKFADYRCTVHGLKYDYFCHIKRFKCSYSKIYT